MTRRRGCESIFRGRWPVSCFSSRSKRFPHLHGGDCGFGSGICDSQTGGRVFTRGRCFLKARGRDLKTCGRHSLSVYGTRRTDFRISSPAARICRGETASRDRVSASREPAAGICDAENAFRRSGGAIRHPGNAIGHRKDAIRGPGNAIRGAGNAFRDSEDVTRSSGEVIRRQDFDGRRAKDAIRNAGA